jgi:hypothetical protein
VPWITLAKFAVNYTLFALLLCIAGWACWRWLRPSPETGDSLPEDRVDTVLGWHPSAVRIMTAAEQNAFDTVRAALPECIVLSQVPLSRFIRVSQQHSYTEWLRRVGNQCADVLVCNSASKVLAVIEVRSSTAQTNPRVLKQSARKAETLRAAGLAFHIWPDTALPTVDQARQLLGYSAGSPALRRETAASDPKPNVAPRTKQSLFKNKKPAMVVEINEAVEDDPPSSWFDELDARVPLVQGKQQTVRSFRSVQ